MPSAVWTLDLPRPHPCLLSAGGATYSHAEPASGCPPHPGPPVCLAQGPACALAAAGWPRCQDLRGAAVGPRPRVGRGGARSPAADSSFFAFRHLVLGMDMSLAWRCWRWGASPPSLTSRCHARMMHKCSLPAGGGSPARARHVPAQFGRDLPPPLAHLPAHACRAASAAWTGAEGVCRVTSSAGQAGAPRGGSCSCSGRRQR